MLKKWYIDKVKVQWKYFGPCFEIDTIDDILLYSNTKEENEKDLKVMLQALREHHLHPKLNKCYFFQLYVHNLGHVISKEGV